jgi:peptide chain release factor 3
MSNLDQHIQKRRTFGIISHPDAGKTTLTEKLLLFGGAIQLAGAVKAKGKKRRGAQSDWMKVERERGISVASAVMTFEYGDRVFNLLDTPGHKDFSEDTYRTLTAVDSSVMVLDSAKGIEAQTFKLFEVCRLRDIPITTFINKMDRAGRDPLELLDEIREKLALDVTPATWPIGQGRRFKGCYDIFNDRLILIQRTQETLPDEGVVCEGLNDPKIDEILSAEAADKMREEVEMVRLLCPDFDRTAFLEGHLSPVYFGSAIYSFGVRELLNGLANHAPSPQPQPTEERMVHPTEGDVTGFVFKIQANMDPRHRDRMAFMRICSGKFEQGMKLYHPREDTNMTMHNPQIFMARQRDMAEIAYPGDIIGVPNHGQLRIGDVLTEGEELHFTGIPNFAPELLKKVRPKEPLKAKHLGKALGQLAEEGVARIFRTELSPDWIVGVVGPLQFDVLADRIRTEFNVPVEFDQSGLHTARWINGNGDSIEKLRRAERSSYATDHDDDPVFLARNAWHLDHVQDNYPDLQFEATK